MPNVTYLYNWVAKRSGAGIVIYGVDPCGPPLNGKQFNAKVACDRLSPAGTEQFIYAEDRLGNTVAVLRLGNLITKP